MQCYDMKTREVITAAVPFSHRILPNRLGGIDDLSSDTACAAEIYGYPQTANNESSAPDASSTRLRFLPN